MQKLRTRRAAAMIAFAQYFVEKAGTSDELQHVLSSAEEIAKHRRSGRLGANHLLIACGVPWAAWRPEPAQDVGRPAPQAEGGSAEQS